MTITWKLARTARVTVTIERGSAVVRTLALGSLDAGDRAAVWDGLITGKKPAAAGTLHGARRSGRTGRGGPSWLHH